MFRRVKKVIVDVLKDESGSEFVEYPMFAVTIVVVALPTVVALRTAIVNRFNALITSVNSF